MENQARSTTTIDEIADSIYRISTPVPPEAMPGGFSFNQYLVVDEQSLLYHTGPRKLFESICAAIERVMPVSRLAYIGFSHVESDECGSLNEFLERAPNAVPLCGQVAAMVSIDDIAIRPPKAMADNEIIELGKHRLRWMATPHVPHGWECSMAFEETTRTLLCGDLFTQPGHLNPPLTDGDILEPSEAFRQQMDYFAHSPDTRHHLHRLAALHPSTLACMHGSAWRGDGAKLLSRLSDRLTASV